MNRIYTFLFTLIYLFPIQVTSAQTIISDASLEPGNTYTWTKDKEYLLDGFVFLEEGSTLHIEAGTVIKALETPTTGDNASALIVTRNAQIFANGTADEPVVFTTEYDDIMDPSDLTAEDNGLWGGLIILGNGTIARPTDAGASFAEDQIEGVPSDETRARYGGDNNDDNSGILRYVSIRHGGAELAAGDEINGLTLGAVGKGTTIEFLEVFANQDDGIEWFGGAVECKNLVVAFCGDDGMDYDYGWRGKGQYWLVVQGEESAGNGGEHDGAKPDGESPFSKPEIYNVTYIGSGPGATADNDFALLFRDRAGGVYANSIFTSYRDKAISVEDLPPTEGADSYMNLLNGDLVLKNNYWWDFGAGTTLDDIVDTYPDGDDPNATAVKDHLSNNSNKLQDPGVCSISRIDDAKLNPMLNPASPALTGAEVPADMFFDNTGFHGAFNASSNWALNWTALDDYGFFGNTCMTTSTNDLFDAHKGYVLEQNFPNPVTAFTTVSFEIPETAPVSLSVYDLYGKKVMDAINNETVVAGTHTTALDVSTLPVGVYYISLESGDVRLTRKMMIIK